MPKLFLVVGLGGDERLFQKLDLSNLDVVYVRWVDPDKRDTLTTYAAKLIEAFNIEPQSDILGVSLGGLLAIEIAKQVRLRHVIIMSCCTSRKDQPRFFDFFRSFQFQNLVSAKFALLIGPLIKPLFNSFAGKNEAHVFYSMYQGNDPRFLNWAIRAVPKWNGEPVPYPINHIIGDRDALFYNERITDAVIIPKGDHNMVYNQSKDLDPIIRKILES